MAASGQLPPERNRREGVPGVAERGEEEPASLAQTSSARSRTIRLRSSGSNAMCEAMSVPTPASR
jgi:hypothetical protein